MKHQSRFGERTPCEIDFVWLRLSVEQRKKCIEEHSKKYEENVIDMFEFAKVNSSVSFLCQFYLIDFCVKSLNPAELRSFQIFMKNRARGLEDGDKNSKSISASLKSSEGSSDSPSKESAASVDAKFAKSPSKIQPSVNANVKSSTEKEDSTTLTSSTLVASQSLFKAGKMTEPLKPPA
jgi:hypothetical protein